MFAIALLVVVVVVDGRTEGRDSPGRSESAA